MDLLAAEITARTGKDPGEHYQELTANYGTPYYTRIDPAATPNRRSHCRNCRPRPSRRRNWPATRSGANYRTPGNGAPIGGLKVVTASGWFSTRPSGTENIYKIYAESFKEPVAPDAIVSEAQHIVDTALAMVKKPDATALIPTH